MNDSKAYELAVAALRNEMKPLNVYAQRYISNPRAWPELRDKYERYIELLAAIKLFEGKLMQKTLFS